MQKLIVDNKLFLLLCLCFWVLLSALTIIYTKAELHLMLNTYHTPFLDFFFKYFTDLGGNIPYIVAGILLFYRYSATILIVATQLLTGLGVQILKRIFDVPRPKLFFAQIPDVSLPFVEGVRVYSTHSFPSGHTTAVFSLFLCLGIITNNKNWQALYFVCAALAAYSRIYLSQHFAQDIFAGSVMTVFITLAYAYYHQKYVVPRLGDKNLKKNIVNLKSKS